MTDFDNSKIAPDIFAFIQRAGELEEAEVSIGLRKHANQEESTGSSAPITPLRTLQFRIEAKSTPFNMELAQAFIDGDYLAWGHQPKEYIKWLADCLSEESRSYSQIYFALQNANPVTPILHISSDSLHTALAQLTRCGLLHTESGVDGSNKYEHPTEKFFFNFNHDAQTFLADLLADSKDGQIDLQINKQAMEDLQNLLNHTESFKEQSGLIIFLQQFDVPSSQAIGSGAILNRMDDFSSTNRQLIDYALSCATQANILTCDDRGLYRLTPTGKEFLKQLTQGAAA